MLPLQLHHDYISVGDQWPVGVPVTIGPDMTGAILVHVAGRHGRTGLDIWWLSYEVES